MIAFWVACLVSAVIANAEFTTEQFKLQFQSEEAEHLEQRLEVRRAVLAKPYY